MESRDNILNELRLLNSTLTQANLENVYKVPTGYFEGLAEDIMSRINKGVVFFSFLTFNLEEYYEEVKLF